MNLHQTQNRFEKKTLGGHELEILACDERLERPIIGMLLIDGKWASQSWFENGLTDGSNEAHQLVAREKFLPSDILCKVWNNGDKDSELRYSDGGGSFNDYGATNAIGEGSTDWDNYVVMEQEAKPWFNDKACPIPEGLEYFVRIGDQWFDPAKIDIRASKWNDALNPITAYQITGGVLIVDQA